MILISKYSKCKFLKINVPNNHQDSRAIRATEHCLHSLEHGTKSQVSRKVFLIRVYS